ncbi:unnamed protein product [Fraxinus pennsylvanica]|uniref:Uncharacterized protein n=1 Tax=Fraxinus pennsylvanica TaxID=56036 RepID=A0AAD1YM66_9LAMI|nr:unnamed protein product [Fraxinus pennsylvanica]
MISFDPVTTPIHTPPPSSPPLPTLLPPHGFKTKNLCERRLRVRSSNSCKNLCKPGINTRSTHIDRNHGGRSISDKLQALKCLIPSHNENAKAEELFEETANHIVLLEGTYTHKA